MAPRHPSWTCPPIHTARREPEPTRQPRRDTSIAWSGPSSAPHPRPSGHTLRREPVTNSWGTHPHRRSRRSGLRCPRASRAASGSSAAGGRVPTAGLGAHMSGPKRRRATLDRAPRHQPDPRGLRQRRSSRPEVLDFGPIAARSGRHDHCNAARKRTTRARCPLWCSMRGDDAEAVPHRGRWGVNTSPPHSPAWNTMSPDAT